MTKTNFAKDQLKSLVERVERLEVEKRALTDDIKEIYEELTDLYLSVVNGSYP